MPEVKENLMVIKLKMTPQNHLASFLHPSIAFSLFTTNKKYSLLQMKYDEIYSVKNKLNLIKSKIKKIRIIKKFMFLSFLLKKHKKFKIKTLIQS
jgi:hypothetical protein